MPIICPYCGVDITKQVMRKMGKVGGAKSKRHLSPEEAKRMVTIREAKKKGKGT